MRKLLTATTLAFLLVGCNFGMPSDTTADTNELTLMWKVTPEEPGEFDMPRNSLALVLSGAIDQTIELGTYQGSFSDTRNNAPENSILSGMFWWAGAGDEFVVERTSETNIMILHRTLEEEADILPLIEKQSITIPATVETKMGPAPAIEE